MIQFRMRDFAVLVCISLAMTQAVPTNASGSHALNETTEVNEIDGLWRGAWGGGGGEDGVVFQPVIAELLIDGDRIEMFGFPNIQKIAGTVRFNTDALQMEITPTPSEDEESSPKVFSYAYEITGDDLKLIDQDGRSIELKRVLVTHDPLVNVQVEFFAASGIDDSGNLLVTPYRELKSGNAAKSWYEPLKRTMRTKKATVLLVQESGCKKVTIDEARILIKESPTVAVAYRDEDRVLSNQFYQLWSDAGTPMPDNEAVWQTYSRTMRPGTLIFVLSSRENIPHP